MVRLRAVHHSTPLVADNVSRRHRAALLPRCCPCYNLIAYCCRYCRITYLSALAAYCACSSIAAITPRMLLTIR